MEKNNADNTTFFTAATIAEFEEVSVTNVNNYPEMYY
jgi:hypothetical protein